MPFRNASESSSGGWPAAKQAPTSDPRLTPPMRSMATPAASSSSITPRWARARAPPPDNTIPIAFPTRRRAVRSTLGCRSEPSGTTCTSRGRRAARTSSETAGARTASSQPSRASGRSTQARLGAPRLSAKTASASRTQKSVHSSPGAAASPTRTTRSFSDSARSSSEVISAEDVRPGSGASLATLPCRRSAVASSSAASATGAPSSSGRAAIVCAGVVVVAGVRLAASCAPIARVKPRAKAGASRISPSN